MSRLANKTAFITGGTITTNSHKSVNYCLLIESIGNMPYNYISDQ